MAVEIVWLTVYRAVLIIVGVLGVGGIYLAFDRRHKPGGTPLLVLFIGALVYIGTKLAVSVVRGTPPVFIITRFNPLGADVAAVGFVLLVLEYTGIEQPITRRTAALLLGFPAVVNILVWLNIEYLWVPTGRDAGTLSGYAWELTSVAIAEQLYINLLLIVGFVLLLRFGLQSTSPFKRQAEALVLIGLAPVIGNLVFYAGYVPVNLAPIMFVFSGVGMVGLLLRGQLLDLVPISRDIVYDSLETGVLTVDTDHRIIDINSVARRAFGFDTTDRLIGQRIDEVVTEQPAMRDVYQLGAEMDSNDAFEIESDGRYYEIEPTDVRSGDGSVIARSFLIRDTTDRRKQQQALERKNAELEHLVGVLSHDIVNPLHVIQGHIQLAREDDDIEPHLDTIGSNADRIETIVDETLTLTRGTDVTDIGRTEIRAVAERAWTHVDTETATLEAACSRSIEADPNLLERLFENLFRNAIEHGKSVTVVRVGEIGGTDTDTAGFFIEDDGVGISDDDRETVLEDGYTTSEDGTGLGLSIVSNIIDAHGWQLRITESEAGGARFEITDVEFP